MHGPMLATPNRVRGGSGSAVAYARHGLILTRPFHDKRVVELALAIPQDLYVKDGRNRYLACQALRHIYPREFQQRGRRRDDLFPDFQAAIHRAKPEILADIARMEASASLTAMIDFPRLRALLHARGADDHNSGWEAETHAAMNAYSIARYVEWFRRDNR
jgi:asparagine synthase (glutamine-hydrolysing)